jgi:hypothetical protein
MSYTFRIVFDFLKGSWRYLYYMSYKISGYKLGVVAHIYNPNTGRLRQEDCEFQTNLHYTEWPYLKKTKDKQTKPNKHGLGM